MAPNLGKSSATTLVSGFSASNVTFDLKKVVDRSRKIANQLSAGVKHLLKKNKVEVFDGHGRLNGPGKLKVEKDGKPVADLAAKHIILATGARARSLPGLEPDGKLVWTSEAMVPPTMPNRCWWSAVAPSASSSPASTAPSAPR